MIYLVRHTLAVYTVLYVPMLGVRARGRARYERRRPDAIYAVSAKAPRALVGDARKRAVRL